MKPLILYDNRLSNGTPIASTTAAGYAVANLTDWRGYTWWKPTALPATITVDCGSAKSADYALIHSHDLFSKGCSVEVRGSSDGFGASNVLLASLTPTSDAPVLLTFNAVSYRYWRITLTGAGSMPALAIAAIGSRLELPTYLPQGFDPTTRKVVGKRNTSSAGQSLGRVVDFEQWEQSISLQRVPWSWIRATWIPAWQAHLRSAPFGFAWDKDTDATDVKLVTAGDDFSTPHYSGSTADLSFDLEAVA